MKRGFIFILIFWAIALSSFAQQPGTVLTFKDAVQLALKNNVTLNTQRNNLYQSKALKAAGIAGMGPQVYVNGNVYQRDGNQFIQQEGTVVNAVVNGASASLNINQPILGGFSSLNNMRSTSKTFDSQLEQVNRSTEDVIGSVAMQYLQVLLDEELVKIAKENVAVQKAQFDQVKAQVELGARSPVDEYNQLALLSNAELRVAQAENTLVVDRTTLFQTLLVDPTTVSKVETPHWDVNTVAMEIGDLESLLSRAEEKRSDLKMVRYAEKASKYSWQSNKGFYYPSLSAFYQNGSAFNQLKDADPSDPAYRNFNQQFFTDNRFNTIGLSVYIPIVNGLQSRYRTVQARTLYENNKLTTRNREILVKNDVVKAYENFANVKAAYAAGNTGLEASKMAFDLETERYNLGVTAFVDLANATRTYVQAQTDLAQAKYRLLFQKVLLDYALGELTVEDIP